MAPPHVQDASPAVPHRDAPGRDRGTPGGGASRPPAGVVGIKKRAPRVQMLAPPCPIEMHRVQTAAPPGEGRRRPPAGVVGIKKCGLRDAYINIYLSKDSALGTRHSARARVRCWQNLPRAGRPAASVCPRPDIFRKIQFTGCASVPCRHSGMPMVPDSLGPSLPHLVPPVIYHKIQL